MPSPGRTLHPVIFAKTIDFRQKKGCDERTPNPNRETFQGTETPET